MERKDRSLGYAVLRVSLGFNIFMHCVTRLLAGSANFVNSMAKMFQGTVMPSTLVVPFAHVLPWLEGVIGVLILLGLRTREALVAGALLMLVLTFGTALRQDWDVVAIQLFYSLIYALLIAALRFNTLSLDAKAFPRS